MANESIRAAFERMWQHTVAKIEDEIAGLEGGGINVLVVTAEWDEENEYIKASHTPKQIYDYIQSGGVAVLKTDDNFVYHLYYANEESTYFFHVDDGLTLYLCEINDARECSFSDQGLASQRSMMDLRQMITVDENGVPSMTSQQIYNFILNGGRVILKYNDQIYSLASCWKSSAHFNYYDDEYRMYCIEIIGNEVFEHRAYDPADANQVSEQLGSIDEALTEILEIQQSLIDSVLPQAEGVEF